MRFPKADWRTKDGSVRLYRGDCLEVLPKLPDGCVDAVVTDPPYSSGGQFRGDRANRSTREKYQSTDVKFEHAVFTGDNRDQRGWVRWMTMWLLDATKAAKPGAMLCTFTDWRQLPATTDAIQAAGWLWLGVVPWDKVNGRPMPNRFTAQAEYVVWGTNGPRSFELEGATYHGGVLRGMPPTGDRRVHSTQKPVDVIEKLAATAPTDGVVLDPFMGSGTTGVACVQTGRRFIGIEKEPRYFDIAVHRIEAALAAQRQSAKAAA